MYLAKRGAFLLLCLLNFVSESISMRKFQISERARDSNVPRCDHRVEGKVRELFLKDFDDVKITAMHTSFGYSMTPGVIVTLGTFL